VVAQGVILLVLIAALIALFTTRVRRRMGLSVTGKTWIIAMVVVVLVVLALWDGSSR
jgi:fumarate reductase subunit D